MTDSVIECRNLTHCYGERLIYKDLSFEVPRGRILGLLGKNGTGKTTTINILSGYLQPRAGQCLIFGEDIRTMRPETRARIALLIEGHVQYAFMTIEQIERFYARFYPRWNRDAYYGLMEMLKVAPRQRISRMSCGQRSQVALGLILAQNADLLVLDDFSMGLDPGYRRLFVEYLRDYAQSEEKTVFLTSHIIQDMESSWTTVSSWITEAFWYRCPSANCSARSGDTPSRRAPTSRSPPATASTTRAS